MDCPHCKEKPVGLFPGFRLHGTSFKESLKGRFRCKNCNSLLEVEKNTYGFPKAEAPYWFYNIGFAFFILLLGSYSSELMQMFSISNDTIMAGVAGMGILLIGIIDSYIKPQYWYISKAEAISHYQQQTKKLTSKGWIILGGYLTITLGSYIWLFNTTDFSAGPQIITLSAIVAGTLLIIGGSFYIFKTFSD